MKAQPGDWLVVESMRTGEGRREGQIVGVDHQDGSPPYRVRWSDNNHETLVFPGPDGRVTHQAPHS
jgi:Domain of unknown function (DUF1918)